MQFFGPPSGLGIRPAGGAPTGCNYNATGSSTPGPAAPNSSYNCNIVTTRAGTSSGVYNNQWLRVEIPIPASYTCTTDCWWSVTENFGTGSSPSDRLTLSADVYNTSPG